MSTMEKSQYYMASVSEMCSGKCAPQFMKYQLIGGTIAVMLWHADAAQRGQDCSTAYENNCCHSFWNTDQLLAHLRCNPMTSIADHVILSVGYQESRNLGTVFDHFLFLHHLKTVIQMLREKGCREIILTNVPPCAAASRRVQHWKILKALNNNIQKMCEENEDLFLCNIFQLFCSPNDFKRRKEYVINGIPNYNVKMKLYNETSIHNPNNCDLISFSNEGKKILWQHLKRTIEYRSRVRTIAIISDPLLLLNHIKYTQAILRNRIPPEKKIPITPGSKKDPRPTKDLLGRQPVSELIEQVSNGVQEFVSTFQTKINKDAPKVSAAEAVSVPQILVIGPEPSLISNTADVVSSKARKPNTMILDETIRTATTSPVFAPEPDPLSSTNKDLPVENPVVPDPRSTSECVPSLLSSGHFESTTVNHSISSKVAGGDDKEKYENDEMPTKNYSVKSCLDTQNIYQPHNDGLSIETRHRNHYVHVQPFIEPMIQFEKTISDPQKFRDGPTENNLSALPAKSITSAPPTDSKTESIVRKKNKLDPSITRTSYLPKPIFQKDLNFRKLASNVDFKHVRARKTNGGTQIVKPSKTSTEISEILNNLSKYEPNTIAYEISKSTFSNYKIPTKSALSNYKIPTLRTDRLKTDTDCESVEKSGSPSSSPTAAFEDKNKEIQKKLREHSKKTEKNPARSRDQKIKAKLRAYDDPIFLSHEFFCGCKLCQKGHRQLLQKLYKFVRSLKKSSD